jgi:hypothetical protein
MVKVHEKEEILETGAPLTAPMLAELNMKSMALVILKPMIKIWLQKQLAEYASKISEDPEKRLTDAQIEGIVDWLDRKTDKIIK